MKRAFSKLFLVILLASLALQSGVVADNSQELDLFNETVPTSIELDQSILDGLKKDNGIKKLLEGLQDGIGKDVKDIEITAQAKNKLQGTLDKLEQARKDLEIRIKLVKDKKKVGKIQKTLDKIGSLISKTAKIVNSSIKPTIEVTKFVLSIKGVLALSLLGCFSACVSEKLFGEDYVFAKVVVPMTGKFAKHFTYVIATVAKTVVAGFKDPIIGCLDDVKCKGEVTTIVSELASIYARARGIVAKGVVWGHITAFATDPIGVGGSVLWSLGGTVSGIAVTVATGLRGYFGF